jgi:hypothetical protein
VILHYDQQPTNQMPTLCLHHNYGRMPKGGQLGESTLLAWGFNFTNINIVGVQMKYAIDPRPFCFCGRLATQIIKGIHFCGRHTKLKREVQRQPEQHGRSKSPNRFYDYK